MNAWQMQRQVFFGIFVQGSKANNFLRVKPINIEIVEICNGYHVFCS